MVGQGRLELPTSRLSSARSNQLSYWPAPSVRTGRPYWAPAPDTRTGSVSRHARAAGPRQPGKSRVKSGPGNGSAFHSLSFILEGIRRRRTTPLKLVGSGDRRFCKQSSRPSRRQAA